MFRQLHIRRSPICATLLVALLFSVGAPASAQAGLLCRWYGINCPPEPYTGPPYVTHLTVSPDSFDGFALYDVEFFTVTAHWSDGIADPDSRRTGARRTRR